MGYLKGLIDTSLWAFKAFVLGLFSPTARQFKFSYWVLREYVRARLKAKPQPVFSWRLACLVGDERGGGGGRFVLAVHKSTQLAACEFPQTAFEGQMCISVECLRSVACSLGRESCKQSGGGGGK